jgi:TetR/AcrR family transcriptional regulator, cholesterol catabolism regulator
VRQGHAAALNGAFKSNLATPPIERHRHTEPKPLGALPEVIQSPTNRNSEGRASSRLAPRRRRQELLDASAAVFHRKGYASASTQDIADAVGILKGSLYYYIRSKEDLLFEIIRSVHDDRLDSLDGIREVEGDALQRIRVFVEVHLIHNVRNLDRIAVFHEDFRSLTDARQEKIVRERDRYDSFLRDLIRNGQEEQLICPDVDPKLAAAMVLGMMNWIYRWYQPDGHLSVAGIASTYGDFVIGGLACDRTTHTPGHRRAVASLHAEPTTLQLPPGST